jgi:hypothetical protein
MKGGSQRLRALWTEPCPRRDGSDRQGVARLNSLSFMEIADAVALAQIAWDTCWN